jgi:hypothetical protein
MGIICNVVTVREDIHLKLFPWPQTNCNYRPGNRMNKLPQYSCGRRKNKETHFQNKIPNSLESSLIMNFVTLSLHDHVCTWPVPEKKDLPTLPVN